MKYNSINNHINKTKQLEQYNIIKDLHINDNLNIKTACTLSNISVSQYNYICRKHNLESIGKMKKTRQKPIKIQRR